MGHVPTTRGHSSITTREAQLAYFISFPGDMVWLDSKFGYTSFDCTVLPCKHRALACPPSSFFATASVQRLLFVSVPGRGFKLAWVVLAKRTEGIKCERET